VLGLPRAKEPASGLRVQPCSDTRLGRLRGRQVKGEGRQLVAKPTTASAGQTLIVPAGTAHSEGNLGDVNIEGVVELRPALRTKEFHDAVAGLVADGRTTARGRRETHCSWAPRSGTSVTRAG
jgi:hypothetical protein